MNIYKRHRFPSEIIQHAVWLYHRFNLSFRDIEDLLHERAIDVSYEAIRLWCNKFGPEYAKRLKKKRVDSEIYSTLMKSSLRLMASNITFGVPFFMAGYNGYFEITQSASHVAVMQEMAHETRLIPVDNRPHIPGQIEQWMGDSKGRWEGDTFVVETKNLSDQAVFLTHPASNLHLVERYELMDADTLMWTITVNDETVWQAPWTMQINLKRSVEPIYEYACHEGNESMTGILAGHRAEEAEQAASQSSGGGQ